MIKDLVNDIDYFMEKIPVTSLDRNSERTKITKTMKPRLIKLQMINFNLRKLLREKDDEYNQNENAQKQLNEFVWKEVKRMTEAFR